MASIGRLAIAGWDRGASRRSKWGREKIMVAFVGRRRRSDGRVQSVTDPDPRVARGHEGTADESMTRARAHGGGTQAAGDGVVLAQTGNTPGIPWPPTRSFVTALAAPPCLPSAVPAHRPHPPSQASQRAFSTSTTGIFVALLSTLAFNCSTTRPRHPQGTRQFTDLLQTTSSSHPLRPSFISPS